MSALGQKQTCAVQLVQSGMSALPPKADMCGALAHVCFVPKADIRGCVLCGGSDLRSYRRRVDRAPDACG
jgi:hypothetical protein